MWISSTCGARWSFPLFLAVFVLVLYLLGKFFGAGIGRWIWSLFEGFIERLPVIRKVYSSVKQVTDYVFDEPGSDSTASWR